MRRNKLREMLNADQPTLSTHIHSPWPTVIEAVGHTGLYDYVEWVAEYAPFDLHDFEHLCRTVELFDMGSMIKIDQEPRTFIAQRAIGSGFQSVLFTDCRTADEVRECVRVARPDTPEDGGTYGAGARRFAHKTFGGSPDYEDYLQALRDIVVAIMVEKKSAVAQLDEILDLDGVDMIQWGGSDYSMSVGMAGQSVHPDVKKVEKMVFNKSLNAGKHPRAEIGSPDQAREYLDMGVRHFSIGTDISILYDWWTNNGDELRKVMEGH